ncbi:MAG: hypothetical protein BWY74_00650 [Firmicutes bacterium ADurb.Bin419]|nr:MAG: hypothetical protein BWY74_00650 [Firmicutes bacterium ADurb.Bin419]
MKSRILSLLMVAVMLMLAVAGLTGCSSGDGSASGKVSPKSEKTIGNVERDGVEIVIPAGTFDKDVKVSINRADENEISAEDGASYLLAPIELKSDGIKIEH